MKFYSEPGCYVSYQGETTYEVGPEIPGKGKPKAVCRKLLWHSELTTLNYPESFWQYMIAEVGTVKWDYNPSSVKSMGKDEYPCPEIVQMFPGFVPARFAENYTKLELQGEYPVLVADTVGFTTAQQQKQDEKGFPTVKFNPILWKGIAPEMTKELWFQVIFPNLHPVERVKVYNYLPNKNVRIPDIPAIPDQVYVYCRAEREFDIRLSRLDEPTQYFSETLGWMTNVRHASVYWSRELANQHLTHANETLLRMP